MKIECDFVQSETLFVEQGKRARQENCYKWNSWMRARRDKKMRLKIKKVPQYLSLQGHLKKRKK